MSQFKLIKGGGSTEPGKAVDWQQKFAALRAMHMTLHARRHGGPGPRRVFSALVGLIAGGVATAGFGALSKAGVDIGPWVSNGVPLALFVLAYQLGLRYSKKPWTYTAKLDSQLANYAPLNIEAYRQLQERTKRVGSLETRFVLDWLEQERYAIELAAGGGKAETKGFLDKKV